MGYLILLTGKSNSEWNQYTLFRSTLYSIILEEMLRQKAENSSLLNKKQSRVVPIPTSRMIKVPQPSSFATVTLNQCFRGM
jgi:hypothetical protein